MGLGPAIMQMILRQRGSMFGWVPVCLAVGIGTYFGLRWEPSLGALFVVGSGALLMVLLSRFASEVAAPFILAIALIAIGFTFAAARAHHVAGPVLGWRYYGPVEGRVVAIDRSQSDALRLTLDRVTLARVPPDATPDQVRVSLHGDRSQDIAVMPGLRVMVTAHLSPPSGPVEPGGFDFQRHAWFARLGAVGYARTPLMGVSAADEGWAGLVVFRVRMAASAHIQAALPGDIGGFAAAITTGDRSAISQEALLNLRISNLAHLLAISGLHMGLLSGVVFSALRLAIALCPFVALRIPARSIAAGGALMAAAGYLALSGGNVATERAFIMVAVALSALMMNRRAISLRAVAVAATIVLTLRPEALMGPGFQMSFAATTALVAIFGWLRDSQRKIGPTWLRPVVAVVLSSGVAGLATAPIAAAHFNAIAHYGLIANLVSVPLMGVLVIPAAVVAAVLAPLGLDFAPLWAMGMGLRWILGVADWIASLEGARGYVVGPGPMVLPLLSLGFLFLVLWQGRLRFVGVMPMVLSFWLWADAPRPVLLISDTGTLVGVMTPEGRALSKSKGAGFIAQNWLENDGDGADQTGAAARWPQSDGPPRFNLAQGQVVHLSGKRAAAAFEECVPGQIIVASVPIEKSLSQSCMIFDPSRLKTTGSVSFFLQGGKLVSLTARDVGGTRLWSHWPEPRPRGRIRDQ